MPTCAAACGDPYSARCGGRPTGDDGAAAGYRAQARLLALAGRLDNLSPLAVLARGYAVCWNADRTAIVRTAAAVTPGDRVRVTLHEGELDCEVRGSHGPDH